MPPGMQPVDATREVLLGFIRIHILYHASRSPVYGLWLIEELAEHGYRLSAGTLYPILHGLSARGLLSRSERLWNGKIRKYYRITARGKKALTAMQRQLAELAAEVLPRPLDKPPARRAKRRSPPRWGSFS